MKLPDQWQTEYFMFYYSSVRYLQPQKSNQKHWQQPVVFGGVYETSLLDNPFLALCFVAFALWCLVGALLNVYIIELVILSITRNVSTCTFKKINKYVNI